MLTGAAMRPDIRREPWGATADGTPVDLFTLNNSSGMVARIATYGGILVSLVHGRNAPADVMLGFDALEPYLGAHPYFGALIGRYANRIAEARFRLNGVTYQLARNDGNHSLHGGRRGFDRAVWDAEADAAPLPALRLTYVSPSGEEGYPGAVTTEVTYTLLDEDALRIRYVATTDAPTMINLTNHAYFNLSGDGHTTIRQHRLLIDADRFLPVRPGLIPTGELREVSGTPFDFRRDCAIGERIDAPDDQLRIGAGFDHTFVLNGQGGSLRLAARLSDPESGRLMEVHTTQRGLQLYTGNLLDGSLVGKGGARYGQYAGLCLETQGFPNAPNEPAFPSPVLKPGGVYEHTTEYRFREAARQRTSPRGGGAPGPEPAANEANED